MIKETKSEVVEREKKCLERIALLEDSNKKLVAELEERRRLGSEEQHLQSTNDKLNQKLKEIINSNEVALERYKLLEEWKDCKRNKEKDHRRNREQENGEEVKRLQGELEEQKRIAKKCKSEYLKAKKEMRYPMVKGSEESSEGSASSTASPGIHNMREREVRPQYRMNRGEYGVRQITSARINPP